MHLDSSIIILTIILPSSLIDHNIAVSYNSSFISIFKLSFQVYTPCVIPMSCRDAFRKYAEGGLNQSIKISEGACVAC